MLEANLFSLLSQDAGVSALVGTRIYPVSMPIDNSVFPCLTYQVVSAAPTLTLGRALLQSKRIQIDAWGESYMDGKNVQAAVASVLIGFTGLLPDGVTNVISTMPGVELDDYQSAGRIYRAMVEYIITFGGN